MNLSYHSPKTEVCESRIHGQGLFAKEPIAKGEIVAVKGGYILSTQQWLPLEDKLGPAHIQIAEDLFIAPIQQEQRDGGMLYTNHSCDPNITLQGQIVFVAMRDITPGEELAHNWATTDDLEYEMQCHCGAAACRGVITGKDWMKKELQKKYQGWFCWFLQQKIDALAASKALDGTNPTDAPLSMKRK